MSDQTSGGGSNPGTDEQTGSGSGRTWQGSFGGHKFRVRWDPGAWRAGESDTSSSGQGSQGSRRGFGFEWEHDPEGDQKAQEDFEQVMSDLRDRAESVARSAADQALRYAERAAKRARETDWESIGREVRSAIERAMGELESTVGQFRREFESRRGGSSSSGSSSSQRPAGGGAQRVRIEQDDQGDPFGGSPGSGFGSGASASGGQAGGASAADVENRRRAILEELRTGTITLDEAERRLGELK